MLILFKFEFTTSSISSSNRTFSLLCLYLLLFNWVSSWLRLRALERHINATWIIPLWATWCWHCLVIVMAPNCSINVIYGLELIRFLILVVLLLVLLDHAFSLPLLLILFNELLMFFILLLSLLKFTFKFLCLLTALN